ncbi:hypothetical protein [Nannocystis pusilla]|uniref:hypothetical protein n=1 Tax=Nannocystis pusilla TaxID=889268 RepID=UPI003B7692C9
MRDDDLRIGVEPQLAAVPVRADDPRVVFDVELARRVVERLVLRRRDDATDLVGGSRVVEPAVLDADQRLDGAPL